jgi:glycosyltransferase involved in cell wall biosynthesis
MVPIDEMAIYIIERFRHSAMKVSVIIPTRNEEGSIGKVIESIHLALRSMDGARYEILVVDTDSKDKTRETARSLGARVIDEPRRGYGRAYKTGFAEAKGEFIVTIDGDLTYPAESIPELIGMLEKESLDFINCDRLTLLEPGVMSTMHKLGNWGLTAWTNLLFKIKIKDSQSGMWVFRRAILEKMELTCDEMQLSEEIKIEAFRKARVKEIPIKYGRREGEAKLRSFSDGWKNLKFLFSKRMKRRREE